MQVYPYPIGPGKPFAAGCASVQNLRNLATKDIASGTRGWIGIHSYAAWVNYHIRFLSMLGWCLCPLRILKRCLDIHSRIIAVLKLDSTGTPGFDVKDMSLEEIHSYQFSYIGRARARQKIALCSLL